MRTYAPLRPELASVCRFLSQKPGGRVVRPLQPGPGILGALASGLGLQ